MNLFKNEAGASSEVVVKAEETYQTPLFLAGFVLPLGQLLKVADDWAVARTRQPRSK